MQKIKTWIINHDDSNLFLFLYISLAVVLSITISLFWLVIVVFIHFIFECIKQRDLKGEWSGVLIRSSWELLLDFGLIFFAFLIAIYMEVVLGAAGIGAGARAGIQSASKAGTRFAGWQRAIRGVLLSLDDLAQVSKTFVKGKSKNDEIKTVTKYGGWIEPWSWGDKITFTFTVTSILLILIAPIFTNYSLQEVMVILKNDMRPFP